MTASPRISVVIPCYNAGRFLQETLTSVLQQTYPAYEVVVVDDGSSDDSASIAAAFGSPVRVILQSNHGESVARNRGIDEARGDWIAFLDADDLWAPAKLERQLSCLGGQYQAVCTGAHIIDADSGLTIGVWSPKPGSFTADQVFSVGCPCLISTLLVRADVPVRFPTWTRYGEDAIYLLELARSVAVEVIAVPLATYRRHAKSQSRSARGIELRWHSSFDRWIVDYSNIKDAQERNRLRAAAVRRLTTDLQKAYWQRNWDEFDLLYQHLDSYREVPEVEAMRWRRRYPRWCYQIKDMVDRLVSSA
jgi:glycosyltransferase involved in cell wall biosynthesis